MWQAKLSWMIEFPNVPLILACWANIQRSHAARLSDIKSPVRLTADRAFIHELLSFIRCSQHIGA